MNEYIKPVIYSLFVFAYAAWNVSCIAPQSTSVFYSRPTLSSSNSFIQHESGAIPSNTQNNPSNSQILPTQTTTSPKYPQGSNSRDYVNPNRPTGQFPQSSVNPTASPLSKNTQGSNIRDYVNPNRPAEQSIQVSGNSPQTPQGNNSRDYINPNRPPGQPPTSVTSTPGINTPRPQQPPRRDYVNPNIPNRQPTSAHQTQPPQRPTTPHGSENAQLQPALSIPLQPSRDFVNPQFIGHNQNTVATSTPVTRIGGPTDPNRGRTPRPRPEFPSLPKSRGSIAPPPTNTGDGVISYAHKVSGGATTKSPVAPGSPSSVSSTPGSPQPNATTEKPFEGPTDDELRDFSEALLRRDVNNAARFVTVNYQGKTTSQSQNDEAPNDLLQVQPEAFQIPTIAKLILLHNNYILAVNENEHVTAQEKAEENDLIDTILTTPIMQYTRNYLVSKNKLSRDPKHFKDLLKEIWFSMYSRGGGKIGSSGFEHIFLAELKRREVSGLHNWVYFDQAENTKLADYLGYMKKIDLGDKGAILKYHFKLNGVDKPVNSMFIGTSPELEIALYTTCYVFRVDRICPLRLAGHNFIVRTFNIRYRGKNSIGSAFPEI